MHQDTKDTIFAFLWIPLMLISIITGIVFGCMLFVNAINNWLSG